MRLLALDTTTRAGSVALVEDDRVVVERPGDHSRTHAERLPRELLALLDEPRLTAADVDVFAVAAGPGSFTGLRIGIATVQGLASVASRRVAAISALEALAHCGGQAEASGTIVAAWMDARRGEVFSALYRVRSGGAFTPARLLEIDPPSVGDPRAALARWGGQVDLGSAVFIGDGAAAYAADIRALAGETVRVMDAPLLAGAVGRLAAATPSAHVDPAGVRPVYVRRPDAEIERERTQARP